MTIAISAEQYIIGWNFLELFKFSGDATIATVRDHCETVVEVLLGGDLRPIDTRHGPNLL
jgi:hypothetical protein